MASIIQRSGRSGWYLAVPVPRSLRDRFGGTVLRKAGSTHREALRNRAELLSAVDKQFKAALGELDLVGVYEVSMGQQLSDLSTDQKDLVIDIATQSDRATEPQLEALQRALQGDEVWSTWIERRVLQEAPSAATVGLWKTRLNKVSKWMKRDHLQGMTKQEAVAYKDHLLRTMAQSSVRSELATLKAFWNWGIDHGQMEVNIWSGLTKKLKDSEKKPIAEKVTIDNATAKALETKDYRYLIMRYTGCRANEASGLRHCDINLKDRTITFKEWEQDGMVRRLKGRSKDERTVPINDALFAALQGIDNDGSTAPMWPKSYKQGNQSWGQGWSGSFKGKFGFTSHDLRRNAVTVLAVKGVSPFIVNEITRQKIPGLSEVVSLYVRPTVDELREAMELLG